MEKTKYYKNGNPEAYRFFTEIQWKGLCERDKGMWTKYSENEPAAIPQDVIDFTNANDLSKPCCEEVNKCKELEADVLKMQSENELLTAENKALKGESAGLPDSHPQILALNTEIGQHQDLADLANKAIRELEKEVERLKAQLAEIMEDKFVEVHSDNPEPSHTCYISYTMIIISCFVHYLYTVVLPPYYRHFRSVRGKDVKITALTDYPQVIIGHRNNLINHLRCLSIGRGGVVSYNIGLSQPRSYLYIIKIFYLIP